MVSHTSGTDTRSHRRQHRLEIAAERSKIELAQKESNKRGIAETGDVVPAPEKLNVRAIVSEEIRGIKERVARGEQRRRARRWAETRIR